MASKAGQRRLIKEYKTLEQSPLPFVEAKPNDANVLEWHYIITGPPDTPYFGGQYHGTLTFPSDYPFNPPAIRMITPSGRFQPNTRICLSISDYHPDTWNPTWSVSTILTGLLSFMTGTESTTGAITTDTNTKKAYAKSSRSYNSNNPTFKKIFPDIALQNLITPVYVPPKVEAKKAPVVTKGNATKSNDESDVIEIGSSSPEEEKEVIVIEEEPVSINMIVNPEDRIRARAMEEQQRKKAKTDKGQGVTAVNEDGKKKVVNGNKSINILSSSFLISIAFLVVVIGMGSTIAKGLGI